MNAKQAKHLVKQRLDYEVDLHISPTRRLYWENCLGKFDGPLAVMVYPMVDFGRGQYIPFKSTHEFTSWVENGGCEDRYCRHRFCRLLRGETHCKACNGEGWIKKEGA